METWIDCKRLIALIVIRETKASKNLVGTRSDGPRLTATPKRRSNPSFAEAGGEPKRVDMNQHTLLCKSPSICAKHAQYMSVIVADFLHYLVGTQ